LPGWPEETKPGGAFLAWRADESLGRAEAAKSGPIESAVELGGARRGSEGRGSGRQAEVVEDLPGCDWRMNRRNQTELAAAFSADGRIRCEHALDQFGPRIILPFCFFVLRFLGSRLFFVGGPRFRWSAVGLLRSRPGVAVYALPHG
jgi:hypothetical protein